MTNLVLQAAAGGMWMAPSSQTATSHQRAVPPSGIVIIW